jgi:TPR repeat protein
VLFYRKAQDDLSNQFDHMEMKGVDKEVKEAYLNFDEVAIRMHKMFKGDFKDLDQLVKGEEALSLKVIPFPHIDSIYLLSCIYS